MKTVKDLRIKIFADGADIEGMRKAYKEKVVKGFTTNPSLLKKAGVADYEKFARMVLSEIRDVPISFEVFSDDFTVMEKEARKIALWGPNVNVKIPVTDTHGRSSMPLIHKLSSDGLTLNITAVMTAEQVRSVAEALSPGAKSIVSVFCGRIADTGRDPVPVMRQAADILKPNPKAELLWASTRELLNIFQAESCGCHIITVTGDILNKIPLINKDLEEYSLETVKTFYKDALSLCAAS